MVNRRRIEQQLTSLRRELEVVKDHAYDVRADRARLQVFEGNREWKVLSLAAGSQFDPQDSLVSLMEQLPGAVLRRARGEGWPCGEATCTTCTYVDLLAHPPSEPIASEANKLATLARSTAGEEADPFYAMAQAYFTRSIRRDPNLKRTRNLCWRHSAPGWRLTEAVTRAAASTSPTSPHQDELAELNSEGLFDEHGFWLSPAIVLEGGLLLRRPDVNRPPVDLAALRTKSEIFEREYAEVLQRISCNRRSKAVTTGQCVLPDHPDRPSRATPPP